MKILESLLTIYWAQTTLILLGIGWVIKLVFENKSKKKQINLEIFQQNRLDCVNRFFRSYSDAQHLYEALPIFEILEQKLTANEIDNLLIPVLHDLEKNIWELKIYFDPEISSLFEEISDNLNKINKCLKDLYFGFYEELTVNNKSNQYSLVKSESLKENKVIIEKLTKSLRAKYNQ